MGTLSGKGGGMIRSGGFVGLYRRQSVRNEFRCMMQGFSALLKKWPVSVGAFCVRRSAVAVRRGAESEVSARMDFRFSFEQAGTAYVVSKASRFTHTHSKKAKHLTYNQEGKAGRLTYILTLTTSSVAGRLGVAGELIG